MKKILITGCTGFVGYHLTSRLIKKNYKVIGIDNNSRGRLNRFTEDDLKKFDFKKIDIRNYKELSDSIEEVEAVVAHEICHISNGDMVTSTMTGSFRTSDATRSEFLNTIGNLSVDRQ